MISKQLLVWVCLYFGGLAGSLIHPIYPLVSYMVFYYAPPLWNWWGDALPEWRYSLMAAGAMSFSLLSCQGGLTKLKEVKNLAAPWFLLFGANALVVSMWAIDPERNWEWLIHLLKLIILYFLLPAVIRNRSTSTSSSRCTSWGRPTGGGRPGTTPAAKAGDS